MHEHAIVTVQLPQGTKAEINGENVACVHTRRQDGKRPELQRIAKGVGPGCAVQNAPTRPGYVHRVARGRGSVVLGNDRQVRPPGQGLPELGLEESQ